MFLARISQLNHLRLKSIKSNYCAAEIDLGCYPDHFGSKSSGMKEV